MQGKPAHHDLSPRLSARLQHETASGGSQGSKPQSSAVDPNPDPPNTGVAGAGVSGECLHDCSHETAPCEVFIVVSYVERSSRRWMVYDTDRDCPCSGAFVDEGNARAEAERRNRA